MEIAMIVGYTCVIGLYIYGLVEAWERGVGYVIAGALLWPVGVALGLTRLFTRKK